MAQLGLAGPELPVDLRDRSGLDAALEELVDLDGSGGEHDEGLAVFEDVRGGFEVHGYECGDDGFEFGDFGLGDSLDFLEFAGGGVRETFDCVIAGICEFLDVVGGNAVVD